MNRLVVPDAGRARRIASLLLAACSLALVFTLSLASIARGAEGDLQPVPILLKRVTDTTASLPAEEGVRIEARIGAFEAAEGAQDAVLLVATTPPEPSVDY